MNEVHVCHGSIVNCRSKKLDANVFKIIEQKKKKKKNANVKQTHVFLYFMYVKQALLSTNYLCFFCVHRISRKKVFLLFRLIGMKLMFGTLAMFVFFGSDMHLSLKGLHSKGTR